MLFRSALATDKSGKYAVAKAGEKITVKVETAEGYVLKGLKSGESMLEANSDGTYTLTVQPGSGLDLQAVIEAIQKADEEAGKKDDSTKTDSDTKTDDTTKTNADTKTDDTAKTDANTKTDDITVKTEGGHVIVVKKHNSGSGSSSASYSAVKSVSAATAAGTETTATAAVAGPGGSISQWGFDGTDWSYRNADGSKAQSQWMYLTYNGLSNWYYFDANGKMMSGWFQDADGNTYYLNPVSDGLKGAMKKGSVEIDGQVYVFSDGTTSGVPEGALIK